MLSCKKQSIIFVMVILLGLFLVACQSEPESPASLTAPGISVAISGDICPTIEVQAGQQVTWTNQDSQVHIVRHKPAEGQSQFDSGALQPGDSFSFTFVERGTYPYECSSDGVYTGIVTVHE